MPFPPLSLSLLIALQGCHPTLSRPSASRNVTTTRWDSRSNRWPLLPPKEWIAVSNGMKLSEGVSPTTLGSRLPPAVAATPTVAATNSGRYRLMLPVCCGFIPHVIICCMLFCRRQGFNACGLHIAIEGEYEILADFAGA